MLCIIQARMSSQRLPGKVIMKIGKKEILSHIIDTLKKIKQISEIKVATSTSKLDIKIIHICKKKKIEVVRGNLNNVVSRFFKVLKKSESKFFIRINADSPFIDKNIIKKAIFHAKKSKYDIVTNVFDKTYPKGQSVEIIRSDIFKTYFTKIKKKEHLEHITKFFYDNNKLFKIFNFKNKKNYNSINLSVDTAEDYMKLKKVYKYAHNKSLNWFHLVKIYLQLDLNVQK